MELQHEHTNFNAVTFLCIGDVFSCQVSACIFIRTQGNVLYRHHLYGINHSSFPCGFSDVRIGSEEIPCARNFKKTDSIFVQTGMD